MSKNGFVWFELVTPSVDDGLSFWSEVAALERSEMDMGPMGPYRMLGRGGKGDCGVVAPQMAGVPPHWLSYLAVDDVDASAAAVTAHGGKVHVPPTDIPGVGRFAVVADPLGATFALFRSANVGEGATMFAWNELWTRDAAAVLPFYEQALGFTARTTQMPMGPYHVLSRGGEEVAGLMTSPDPKVPPMWLPYLTVADADAAVDAVRGKGGAVHAAVMAVTGVGRFGIVADRQGAVLGLLRPE